MKALLPLSLLGNLFACIFALAYFNTTPPVFWWRAPAIIVGCISTALVAILLALSSTIE